MKTSDKADLVAARVAKRRNANRQIAWRWGREEEAGVNSGRIGTSGASRLLHVGKAEAETNVDVCSIGRAHASVDVITRISLVGSL